MAPEYERLNDLLNKAPQAVNVVFTASYPWESIAGGTVETKIMAAAWQDAFEKVFGPKATQQSNDFLVDRTIVDKLKGMLWQSAQEHTRLYVGDEDRDFLLGRLDSQLATVMKQLTPPVEPKNLWDLSESAVIYTLRNGVAEVAPVTINDLLKKSREMRDDASNLVKNAESLSDLARDDRLKTKDFHESCRSMSLSCSAAANIALFGASVKMNLSQEWKDLNQHDRDEVHAARTVMSNNGNRRAKGTHLRAKIGAQNGPTVAGSSS
jgi:hypothetical protein